MQVKVTSNAEKVAKRLLGKMQKLRAVASRALDLWARKTATKVKRATQQKGIRRRTGQLLRSISGRSLRESQLPTAVIRADAAYAKFLEFGTKAKAAFGGLGLLGSAKLALRKMRGGGGIRPRRFFFPTIRAEIPALIKSMTQDIHRLMRSK